MKRVFYGVCIGSFLGLLWLLPSADARRKARPRPRVKAPITVSPPRETAPPVTPARPLPPAPRPVLKGTAQTVGCTHVPSDMVCVTGGSFVMGSQFGDEDELPVHRVNLNAFAIDKFEVSFGEYMKCVTARRCMVPRYHRPAGETKANRRQTSAAKGDTTSTVTPSQPVTMVTVGRVQVPADWPVAGVSWTDAQTYCQFKGKVLPTEAQWEYAARGPSSNYYAWGGATASCDRVNAHYCGGLPKSVSSLPMGRSHFGAFHMSGNVWEWVHDLYDPSYYERSKDSLDPPGPENLSDPVTGKPRYRYRVIRGGSFTGIPSELRTAYRYRLLPEMYASDIGFRCSKPMRTGVAAPHPTGRALARRK